MLTAAALRRKLPPAAVAAATAAMATSASWRTARSVRDSGAAARTSARGYVRARLRRLLGLQCLERSRFHDAAYPLSIARLSECSLALQGRGRGRGREGERERERGRRRRRVAFTTGGRAAATAAAGVEIYGTVVSYDPVTARCGCAHLRTSPPIVHFASSCARPLLLRMSLPVALVPSCCTRPPRNGPPDVSGGTGSGRKSVL
jgi:hypothetical protein